MKVEGCSNPGLSFTQNIKKQLLIFMIFYMMTALQENMIILYFKI